MVERRITKPDSSEVGSSVPKKTLGLTGATVLGLLTAFSGKANATGEEDWVDGGNIDTALGTNINDEVVYAFAGKPGVTKCLRNVSGESSSGFDIEISPDTSCTSFTESLNSLLEAYNPDVAGHRLGVLSHRQANDETMIWDTDSNYYFTVTGLSDGEITSWTDLEGSPNAGGSIDESTGRYFGTDYSSGSSYNASEFFSDSEPVIRYNSSGEDTYIQADLTKDRGFVNDSDLDVYKVDNFTTSPSATSLDLNGRAIGYISAEKSPFGLDTLLLLRDNAVHVAYDLNSGAPTDPDSDSDGYPASTDCDDTDASVHPDATEITDDGVDSDCDNADSPRINGISVNGMDIRTLTPDAMPVMYMRGDAVSLSANAGDDEDLNDNLEYRWTVTNDVDGTETELEGKDTSFIPEKAGYHTINLTVTDTDSNSAVASSDFTIILNLEDVLGSGLEEGEVVEGEEGDYLEVTGGYPYITEEGTVELTKFGDSVYAEGVWDIYGTEANTTLNTNYDYRAEAGMGVLGATYSEYGPYVDTSDTTKMMWVISEAGSYNAVGGNGGFDVNIDEPSTNYFADTVPEETDTDSDSDSDSDTDSDSDSDTDTDSDSDSDSDADGDGDADQDTAQDDTDRRPINNDTGDGGNGGCNSTGCSTFPGQLDNGVWLAAGLGLALGARRRKNTKKA